MMLGIWKSTAPLPPKLLIDAGSGAQLRAPTHHRYFNTHSRTQTLAASGDLPYC
ncbi:hypothetical protein ICN21_01055 [Polynucleobacter sp. AP-Feld-500C-C5]|nr:hypothetical protein [Polynucleobacter sp. AP-Feld-500C-C5]